MVFQKNATFNKHHLLENRIIISLGEILYELKKC